MVFCSSRIKNTVIDYWYNRKFYWLSWVLYPVEILYSIVMWCNKRLYLYKVFATHKFNVPVIVVGNITVGGTGKTPMVMYLANYLQEIGFKPGIITRGYKSKVNRSAVPVFKNSDAELFGDEPVILANNTNCPVVIGRQRAKAVRFLLNNYQVNIIIADDGLQHHALARDLEIVMIDGARMFGNGYLLPRGPLREHLDRLQTANLVLLNGGNQQPADKIAAISSINAKINVKQYNIKLIPEIIRQVVNSSITKAVSDFKLVHAVAGIGNNNRFFEALENLGIKIIRHGFPDHYQYREQDFNFNDNLPIVMTEKDAVKCQKFATDNFWYLQVKVDIENIIEFHSYLAEFIKRHGSYVEFKE